MERYLFDTSALVKRYHVEVGSPRVTQIFASLQEATDAAKETAYGTPMF